MSSECSGRDSVLSYQPSPRVRSPVIRIRSHIIHDPNSNTGYVKSPVIGDSAVSIHEGVVLDDVKDIIRNEEQGRWIKGLWYMFLVVVTWVVSLELTNNIIKTGEYQHPLLVAYLNGAFFVIFRIVDGLKTLVRRAWRALTQRNHEYVNDSDSVVIETPSHSLSFREIVVAGAIAGLLYFFQGAVSTAALLYTSASNQTVLFTTSSLFSLILGVMAGVERFSAGKLVAIFASIGGISMIAMADASGDGAVFGYSTSSELLGDAMVVLGACAYSMFLIVLSLKLGQQTDPETDKQVYMWLGVCTILLVTPILGISHVLGIEKFAMPPDKTTGAVIVLCSVLTAVSDYCASVATLLTSPLIVSLSLSTAIPVSLLCDSFFYQTTHTSFWYYVGIVLIFSSFVFTSLSDKEDAIEGAIGGAVTEAVLHNETLSPILTPGASGALLSNEGIPPMSIDDAFETDNTSTKQLVVAGGHHGKYFIREVSPPSPSL